MIRRSSQLFPHPSRALALLAAATLSLTASAQTVTIRPGKYETKLEQHVTGSPITFPPTTLTTCIAAEDVTNLTNRLLGHQGRGCRVTDVKQSPGKVTFTSTCEGEGPGSVELTYTPDSFVFAFRQTLNNVVLVRTITGKRLGECTR